MSEDIFYKSGIDRIRQELSEVDKKTLIYAMENLEYKKHEIRDVMLCVYYGICPKEATLPYMYSLLEDLKTQIAVEDFTFEEDFRIPLNPEPHEDDFTEVKGEPIFEEWDENALNNIPSKRRPTILQSMEIDKRIREELEEESNAHVHCGLHEK